MAEYCITSTSIGSYSEKGSSFTARTLIVRSVDEIKTELNRLKEEFSNASHFCYAYRIKKGKSMDEFAADAGEPKGSAGVPILNVLKQRELVNSAIFVIRYFGGTKLGISGLIHAYGAAAEDALEHTTFEPWVQLCNLSLMYQYEVQKKVESVLKQYGAIILHQNFAQSIYMSINVKETMQKEIFSILKQITNGNITIKVDT